MLILNRRPRESIMIGDNIKITVLWTDYPKGLVGLIINISQEGKSQTSKKMRLKVGESYKISDEISILILKPNNRQAKIGINAPPNVLVDREEVWERKKAEKLKGGER